MIQVSVIADELGNDFERTLDACLENDVKHVELRSLWGTNIATADDKTVAKAKDVLDAKGIKVTAIAGPFFKTHLGPEYISGKGDTHGHVGDEDIEKNYEILDRCFELARVFNTDIVRTFAFWRAGDPTSEVYDKIESFLKEASKRTEAAGLKLGLENEHACFIGSVGESIEILNRVPSQSLGLIWDAGNATHLEPAASVFPDGWERLKKEVGLERIFHVHLKDSVTKDGKTVFTEFGKGDIDFQAHIEALVRDGYKGAISMETHWREEGMSKEEATIICVKNLWEMIDKAGLRARFE